MKQDKILKCLIAFILGFLVARMMRGNGLMVGGQEGGEEDPDKEEEPPTETINIDEVSNKTEDSTGGPILWLMLGFFGILFLIIIFSMIYYHFFEKTPTYIPKKSTNNLPFDDPYGNGSFARYK